MVAKFRQAKVIEVGFALLLSIASGGSAHAELVGYPADNSTGLANVKKSTIELIDGTWAFAAKTAYNTFHEACPKSNDLAQDATSDNLYLSNLAQARLQAVDCEIDSLKKTLSAKTQGLESDVTTKIALVLELRRTESEHENSLRYKAMLGKDSDRNSDYYTEVKELNKVEAAEEATLASIPYIHLQGVKNFVRRELQLFNQGRGPQVSYESMEKSVRANSGFINSLKQSESALSDEHETLQEGVDSKGKSLNANLKESLAQDSSLIDTINQNAKESDAAHATACRVDAKYGSGAKTRDNALLTAQLLGTVATLGLTSAGAAVMSSERILALRGAVQAGKLASSSANIISRFTLAVDLSAAAIAFAKSCELGANFRGHSANQCQSFDVEELQQNNCALNVGLSLLGAAAVTPAATKLIANLTKTRALQAVEQKIKIEPVIPDVVVPEVAFEGHAPPIKHDFQSSPPVAIKEGPIKVAQEGFNHLKAVYDKIPVKPLLQFRKEKYTQLESDEAASWWNSATPEGKRFFERLFNAPVTKPWVKAFLALSKKDQDEVIAAYFASLKISKENYDHRTFLPSAYVSAAEELSKSGLSVRDFFSVVGRPEYQALNAENKFREVASSYEDADGVFVNWKNEIKPDLVGDTSVETVASAANTRDYIAARAHFNEHALSATELDARVAAMNREKSERLVRFVRSQTVSPERQTKILDSLRKSFGDLADYAKLCVVKPRDCKIDLEEIKKQIASCAESDARDKCFSAIKSAICKELFVQSDPAKIGECNKAGPRAFALNGDPTKIVFQVGNHRLSADDMAPIIEQQLQQKLATETEKAQLEQVSEVLASRKPSAQKRENLINAPPDAPETDTISKVLDILGIRKMKETSYWSRRDLNQFLKEVWGDQAEFVESKNITILRRHNPDLNKDAKLEGGSTQLIEVQFGERRINVRICHQEPCYQAKQGQIMAVYPECGPGVVRSLSPEKLLSSMKALSDWQNASAPVPCP